jgi:hypothetical protein
MSTQTPRKPYPTDTSDEAWVRSSIGIQITLTSQSNAICFHSIPHKSIAVNVFSGQLAVSPWSVGRAD